MRLSRRSILLSVAGAVTVVLLAAATAVAVVERDTPRDGSDTTHGGVDRIEPDAVVPQGVAVDVRSFGARGDGRTDDTDALQAAISAGVGTAIGGPGNPRRVLYLPGGTYLVSRPLEWRDPEGDWASGMTLQGQNRDRTIIRLADGAPGFGDPRSPSPVVRTASGEADGPDGSGNRAFGNFLFDLTISVGAGNPGADGLDYLANNRGAVRNVTLRADTGSGHDGISMTRRWPGPCLFENVRVEGFERGVVVARSEYSVTFDGLDLSGQRISGLENMDNVLTVRGLTTRSINGPAVRNLPGSFGSGLLTVLDSDLAGTSPTFPAIENEAAAYVLRVRSTGFGETVRDRGRPVPLAEGDEWSSALVPGTTPVGAPPQQAPPFPPGSAATVDAWAGVDSFGARPDDRSDDTDAVQRALDSGKPVIYLRPGTYTVNRPLTVPPTVEEIAAFDATIEATSGAFGPSSDASVFTVRDGTATPFVLSQIVFIASPTVYDVDRPGSRPIHLRDVHSDGFPFRGGPGDVFLTDVEGGAGWTFEAGQRVWARQFNVEQQVPVKVRNNGARLWVLGIKTESAGTVVVTDSDASTEILGGLLFPVERVPSDQPAFAGDGSRQSLTFAISAGDPSATYATVLIDGSRVVRLDEIAKRGQGGVLPLYRGG